MSVRGIKITADNKLSWVEVEGLEGYQAIVGGYIEAIRLRHNDFMFVNEEGKLAIRGRDPLPPNKIATVIAQVDVIAGDVIIVGPSDGNGGDTSLPETSSTADDVRNVAAILNGTWE